METGNDNRFETKLIFLAPQEAPDRNKRMVIHKTMTEIERDSNVFCVYLTLMKFKFSDI